MSQTACSTRPFTQSNFTVPCTTASCSTAAESLCILFPSTFGRETPHQGQFQQGPFLLRLSTPWKSQPVRMFPWKIQCTVSVVEHRQHFNERLELPFWEWVFQIKMCVEFLCVFFLTVFSHMSALDQFRLLHSMSQ